MCLPAALLALKQVLPTSVVNGVVACDNLHGFGMRASPDMILAATARDGRQELISVEFFVQGHFNFRNEDRNLPVRSGLAMPPQECSSFDCVWPAQFLILGWA